MLKMWHYATMPMNSQIKNEIQGNKDWFVLFNSFAKFGINS